MRWDRIARAVMLVVLSVLLYLYISAGTTYLGKWHEAKNVNAQVRQIERDNARLRAQRASLLKPTTVEAEARRLGMVRPGEQAYIVQNLPPN